MNAAGGKTQNVEYLGRVTVAVQDHLDIVRDWAEETLRNEPSAGEQFEGIINGVRQKVATYLPDKEAKTVQLDVFSAVVVNRSEDKVFFHKRPSSFP